MTQYTLNPFLVLYPNGSGLVAMDPRSLSRLRLTDPNLVQFLASFTDTATAPAVCTRLEAALDANTNASAALVDRLVNAGVLVACDEIAPLEKAATQWHEYDWDAALHYYLLTRGYPFVDYTDGDGFVVDDHRMEQYATEDDVPPIYKTYEDAPTVSLPAIEASKNATSATIGDVLKESTLERSLSGERINRETLSWILYYSFGETGSISFPRQGRFLRKTSPSGGARHPTEAYLAIIDVEDVPAGLYHYSVRDHALEQLRAGDIESDLREAIYELQEPSFKPAFVIVFTSVIERSMWRYREPRTYRVLFQDIGHLIETVKLVCLARGLYSYFGHGFHDDRLESLFGLNGLEEPIFKFAAVGSD